MTAEFQSSLSQETQQPSQRLQQYLKYNGRKYSFESSRLRLPNGVEATCDWIQHPGGALAVPVLADGRFVVIRQYRFAAEGWLLEFPAGTLEPGEDAGETVKRELEEEAGYRGKTWQKLPEFFLAPGYSDEVIYPYLATDLEKLEQPPAQDEDEQIEVVLMTAAELEAELRSGRAIDSRIVTAYWLARPYLEL